MKKFWNWARDENTGVRTLYLDGVIAEIHGLMMMSPLRHLKQSLLTVRVTLLFGSILQEVIALLLVRFTPC